MSLNGTEREEIGKFADALLSASIDLDNAEAIREMTEIPPGLASANKHVREAVKELLRDMGAVDVGSVMDSMCDGSTAEEALADELTEIAFRRGQVG